MSQIQKLTWNVTYYENDSHLRDLKFVTFDEMLSLLKCISYRSCFHNWIRDPNTKVPVAGGRYSFKGGFLAKVVLFLNVLSLE